MRKLLLATALALAGCSTRAEPHDTAADHIAAAAAAPSGVHVDPARRTPATDAAAIELATLAPQLDDAEQALQDAIASHAPADRVQPLEQRVRELRAREDAVRARIDPGAMDRILAHPPQPIAR